ncbi:hypothetical protein [Lysinibacillus xylanilyticus]|uniref:hypothetical protein n=1 Tax=Lysinibacillus xylanilyticus TaxID=582475 RepID=UPI003825F190
MDTIILETIESYNEYLKKVPKGCQFIIDKLNEGAIDEAMDVILQFSEGVSWILEINHRLNKLHFTNQLEVDTIHRLLDDVNNAIELQDFHAVSNIFADQIKPFFEKCLPYANIIS